MVNDQGQLYTIEGVAAGILMIVTTYLVISTSTVFTPQETHITDMQLEQLGHDALKLVNTPGDDESISILNQSIRDNTPVDFKTPFERLLNSRINAENDTLHYNVTLYYRDGNEVKQKQFADDGSGYYRENAVKVTQLVKMGNDAPAPVTDKVILVEVLLWRS